MLLDSRKFECIYTESWDACLKIQFVNTDSWNACLNLPFDISRPVALIDFMVCSFLMLSILTYFYLFPNSYKIPQPIELKCWGKSPLDLGMD